MKCLACGNVDLAPQKFCGECGARLETIEPNSPSFFSTAARWKASASRSRSCDIANSTPLAARVGPDQMHKVLNAFFEAAVREVHRFEGTVNQFLGDGFMALFGAPVSHEDHARRAVLAALAIRQTIASPTFQAHAATMQLRIGLNCGAVVVGTIGDNSRMDYTAVGDTTNVAARIQGCAGPGAIFIGESVYRAVQKHVECHPLGPRSLKGKAGAVVLYEVVQSHTALTANRPAAPGSEIVGRQSELGEIRLALSRLQGGLGGVLGIVGDAGLGKSRLMHEARRQSEAQGLHWLQGECLSFGRTLSYWPFREVIRSGFGIEETDSEADCWHKVEAGMSRLFGANADELLPYIGLLFALELPERLAASYFARPSDGPNAGHGLLLAEAPSLMRASGSELQAASAGAHLRVRTTQGYVVLGNMGMRPRKAHSRRRDGVIGPGRRLPARMRPRRRRGAGLARRLCAHRRQELRLDCLDRLAARVGAAPPGDRAAELGLPPPPGRVVT
jgi:class 3 adenylate cyclase